jgi:hypothetical protein
MENNNISVKGGRAPSFWNILTALNLIGVFVILGYSALIFKAPYSALNPLPPVKIVIPTIPPITPATPTPLIATKTFTPVPTDTLTPLPTFTAEPTDTPFSLASPTPTATFTVTPTPTDPPNGFPFELHPSSPVAIANIAHPELGCDWMGVAGQVFDLSDSPIVGLLIRLGGSLRGSKVQGDMISLTGVALNYGRVGYYEFTLADEPIASEEALWVQLLDQSSTPLSKRIYFETFESCDKNLIIVNFKQVR